MIDELTPIYGQEVIRTNRLDATTLRSIVEPLSGDEVKMNTELNRILGWRYVHAFAAPSGHSGS